MNLKNIFRITPLSMTIFVITYITLWILHNWCLPYTWLGGAIMPNGAINDGLETKCGFFSKWIWENKIVYDIYININAWHILIMSILIILITNIITEAKKNK